MTDGIRLRRADERDAYALWIWANDPETRHASHDRAVIGWREHVDWLSRQLSSADAVVLIAEVGDGRPGGCARFDTADGWRTARLSYVIAPDARGQGLSRPMLEAAVAWLRGEVAPRVTIIARVLPHNDRSLRVFRACGWNESAAEQGAHLFTFQAPSSAVH